MHAFSGSSDVIFLSLQYYSVHLVRYKSIFLWIFALAMVDYGNLIVTLCRVLEESACVTNAERSLAMSSYIVLRHKMIMNVKSPCFFHRTSRPPHAPQRTCEQKCCRQGQGTSGRTVA